MSEAQAYWAPHAWLPGGLADAVRVEVADGRISALTSGVPAQAATRLPGILVPGLANCHSHAFHRALRGRTHDEGGTFWTWRQRMYHVAHRLDPQTYLALARAVYAEMALSGITAVGEFHYLHHQNAGRRYHDPNAMGEALRQAAREAGVRLTLLQTCYLTGGLDAGGHAPLNGHQQRFSDGDIDAWAQRIAAFKPDAQTRLGVALHSVRAVPFAQLQQAALSIPTLGAGDLPVHAHVSEQPAENQACHSFYGRTPVEQFAAAGLLEHRFSAVHATHLSTADRGLLGRSGCTACLCPTTERDLADGIGPARALLEAGAGLSLGSDQHAVVDLWEEARAVEMHERLVSGERGRLSPGQLLQAATAHPSIGWPDAGQLAVGQRADLVAVRLDTVRTAGVDPAQVLLAATAADVDTVVCEGQLVVSEGQHRLGDVGRLLAEAIEPLWEDT